ncbi:MAG: DNA alkylation repair protein [Sneathiella sp.]|nr:DNA alkylation repair protein [Sneathiella sp.]
MADELRALYSKEYISHIAHCLKEEGDVNPQEFIAFILASPWEELALKQRMARLTDGLDHFLTGSYSDDLSILKRLLPRISGDVQKYADMLSMFVPDFTVVKGLNDVDQSLEALVYFTAHGTSSEFAIRPFIKRDAEKVMTRMLDWASHPDPNVRRFASEGCRPRLPWAMALPDFKKDPSLILPILEKLRTDDSKFVQKSVANNLNDIAKDNPDIVLNFADKWLAKIKTPIGSSNTDVGHF